MSWTAPEISRSDFPLVAPERPALENMLDFYRETLLWKCAGLTGEQLAQWSVPPSTMSLLGLVRHLTEVERIWFRDNVAGDRSPGPYKTLDRWDADFEDADGAQAEDDYARHLTEVEYARKAAASHDLDGTFQRTTRRGDVLTFDLRWLYLHMIEEYARHLGHADLLRERIDGVTGA